jgi:hypothetical protein
LLLAFRFETDSFDYVAEVEPFAWLAARAGPTA